MNTNEINNCEGANNTEKSPLPPMKVLSICDGEDGPSWMDIENPKEILMQFYHLSHKVDLLEKATNDLQLQFNALESSCTADEEKPMKDVVTQKAFETAVDQGVKMSPLGVSKRFLHLHLERHGINASRHQKRRLNFFLKRKVFSGDYDLNGDLFFAKKE